MRIDEVTWNIDPPAEEDPRVLVPGVGRYRLSQLKKNVLEKIDDVAKTAKEGDTVNTWRKLSFMLNHAAMHEMVKTIKTAMEEQNPNG